MIFLGLKFYLLDEFLLTPNGFVLWKVAFFVNEEFPKEIQKLVKKQLTLIKRNIAIFYTQCWV